ncbi:uncharacterized protein [Nicotiana sylvestris]|uniref:Uncharacterized protein LOC104225549 isoform X1 n=1 Tax=Nicotiana sylvestris TaxID=4096 RepID=A0A1U7WAK2_NICSY|nr:PREDICTED: uncharacterized protein LOC104225549 isoform X1 [Nicotiana sylvestris]XP_009775674.1 PREDICTED: uncharacterized protein LOC104225549 isoform X1 [Nicotiana sylvestris]
MYRARLPDKRELNLLERRTTYFHSRKQNPTSDSTEVSACYQFNRELARQRAALIGASSSTLRTVNVFTINDSTLSDNGKDLHDRSPIFEVGSTSETCSEQYNITMRNATSKGHTSEKMSLWNTNDLPNSPYRLKTVPNCKFCRAKRFQYGSPGFCCDNGSVKLIHYGLPAKLLNLYLGNSQESKHFRTYVKLHNNMFAFLLLE